MAEGMQDIIYGLLRRRTYLSPQACQLLTGDIVIALADELPKARRTDPDTSKAAAKLRFSGKRVLVWKALKELGHGTAYDCAAHTGIALNSVTSRLSELVRMGYIRDSGERRPSLYRVNNIVYEVTNGTGN